jgi:predicted nucleic acid-binding protein
MLESVYVETTIISYLLSRESSDSDVRAHQRATRRWWRGQRKHYQIYVSPFVLEEAAAGDPKAARRRNRVLNRIPRVAVTEDVTRLARKLTARGAVPSAAKMDSFHIALAAAHGLNYLLTWNCKHIANARKRVEIEECCRTSGFEPPVICTPEEMLED